MKSRLMALLCSTAAVYGAFGVQSAVAQQQAPAPAQAGLEEVIVTAQRRSQGVLSVPASLQAMTGETLKAMGLTNIEDLEYNVPGYTVDYSSGYAQIFVRGIGNSIFVGADPSVATYIDDVPQIYGSMRNNLADVQRVEVLKGAQGGLYGRNATGGVLNIITRQPSTEEMTGTVTLGAGNYNDFGFSGFINVPVSDKIAVSASLDRDHHGYYINNVATKNPYTAAMFPGGSYVGSPAATAAFLNSAVNPPAGVENGNMWTGDAKILVKPTDDFKITFEADYGEKHDSMSNDLDGTNTTIVQGYLTAYLDQFIGANAQLPPGFIKGNLPKFTVAEAVYNPADNIDEGASAIAVWNLPGVDLTAISALRYNRQFLYTDVAATDVPFAAAFPSCHRHYYYEELRAASTDLGRLHLLGGGTYLKGYFANSTPQSLIAPIAPDIPVASSLDVTENYSIYAQASYDFTPELTATLSGRFIHETNTINFTFPSAQTGNIAQQKLLPSANLQYKLGEGNLYARWAKGFKAGGFNVAIPPSAFIIPPSATPSAGSSFKGEQVDSYEVGYRAPFMDHKINFTTSLFFNNYTNLQVSTKGNAANPAIIYAVVNALSARTYGAEETFSYKPIPALILSANAGYLNAQYLSFGVPQSNPVLQAFTENGHIMQNSPRWQFSLAADLDTPLTDQYRLIGNVLESYVGKQFYQLSAVPGVLPDSGSPQYFITNLRLGLRTSDDRYGISFYCKNVFDRAYFEYGSTSSLATINDWGVPRTFGGEITVNF